MLRFRMTVLYRTKQRKLLWSRGGSNGVFVGTYEGKDETTVIVTLPVKHTLAQALTIQRALPTGKGLGVVTTSKGLAIRCEPEHRDEVALACRPDEAAAYGELFSLKKEDSSLYIVHGVDGMITGPILHECLKRSMGWLVKPVRPDKSHSWGCRDWQVWATEPPRTMLFCIRTNEGRQMRGEISKVTTQPRKSAWETGATPQQPTPYAEPRQGVWHHYDDTGYLGQQQYYDSAQQYDGDWAQKCADAAQMNVEPDTVPDYWDPTTGLGDAAEAAAPAADTWNNWADAEDEHCHGWDSAHGSHRVWPTTPAPPPEQELSETPAEFDRRRQGETTTPAETKRRRSASGGENLRATDAAQQANDNQVTSGDATSILIARLQKDQADAIERTRLLHEDACASSGRIESLSNLISGQAQLLANLEGTVAETKTGLTSLENTVTTLNTNVNKIGEDLRAFIAASMAKPAVAVAPAATAAPARRAAERRTRSEADDDETTNARGSDSWREPRSPRRGGTDDSSRSDPGAGY